MNRNVLAYSHAVQDEIIMIKDKVINMPFRNDNSKEHLLAIQDLANQMDLKLQLYLSSELDVSTHAFAVETDPKGIPSDPA